METIVTNWEFGEWQESLLPQGEVQMQIGILIIIKTDFQNEKEHCGETLAQSNGTFNVSLINGKAL